VLGREDRGRFTGFPQQQATDSAGGSLVERKRFSSVSEPSFQSKISSVPS
jgi:hypothetical protein